MNIETFIALMFLGHTRALGHLNEASCKGNVGTIFMKSPN
jgi:hypothetical protein